MKKKIRIGVVTLIVMITLLAVAGIAAAGLYCDHQWQAADCTTPEHCNLCQDIRSEPLGHDWQDADCEHPETCARCALTRGNPLGHNCGEATCTKPEVCLTCKKIQNPPLGHDWLAATCTTPETCTRCGELQEPARGHAWLPAHCTAPETCASCGVTQGNALDHSWQEATCAIPKNCTRCGTTEGETLAHTWQEATCLAPQTCASCGLTQGERAAHLWQSVTCTNPETCVHCGTTRGNPLGHVWQEATCTSPTRCSRCGTVSGRPLGHNFAESTDGVTRLCYTCGKSVANRYLAITFDDGPSGNITDTLLSGLAERGVRSTFFICGYRIQSFPSQPQKILDGGHEIGLHTSTHASLSRLDAEGIRKELTGMMHLLPAGYAVKLMRPPGGAHNATVRQVCGELGLSVVMWSVDPRDWETNDVDTIVNRILNGAKDGSIILMHDLKSSSVRAALQAIDLLQGQGYEFVTVSELAAIKGAQLNPGQVYHSIQ